MLVARPRPAVFLIRPLVLLLAALGPPARSLVLGELALVPLGGATLWVRPFLAARRRPAAFLARSVAHSLVALLAVPAVPTAGLTGRARLGIGIDLARSTAAGPTGSRRPLSVRPLTRLLLSPSLVGAAGAALPARLVSLPPGRLALVALTPSRLPAVALPPGRLLVASLLAGRPGALPPSSGPLVVSTLLPGLLGSLASSTGRMVVSAPGATGVLIIGLPALLGGMPANVEVLLWILRVRRLPSAVALLLSVGRRSLVADPAVGVLVGAVALLRVEREHGLHGRGSGTRRENTFTCSAA